MKHPVDEMISDRQFVDEDLAFGEGLPRGIRGCRLEGCRITLNVPGGGPSIYRSVLTDCIIHIKGSIANCTFFGSDYIRCKFTGAFDGVDFGRSPRANPMTGESDEFGETVECDFREATLDMCRFFTSDVAKHKFAPWPQFVIPYENELAAARRKTTWPGTFGVHMRLVPRQNSALVATTGTVSSYMQEYGLSDRELKDVLVAIGGVI